MSNAPTLLVATLPTLPIASVPSMVDAVTVTCAAPRPSKAGDWRCASPRHHAILTLARSLTNTVEGRTFLALVASADRKASADLASAIPALWGGSLAHAPRAAVIMGWMGDGPFPCDATGLSTAQGASHGTRQGRPNPVAIAGQALAEWNKAQASPVATVQAPATGKGFPTLETIKAHMAQAGTSYAGKPAAWKGRKAA